MEKLIIPGVRRNAIGWAVFLVGLPLLLWLHTWRDHLAHSAILPVFLLMWIVLLVCALDGSRVIAPRWRCVLFLFQVMASVLIGILFFQHLINQS
jgi:hypothetical protein